MVFNSFLTSLENSSTSDHGNSQENFMKQFLNIIISLVFFEFLLSSNLLGSYEHKQVGIPFTILSILGLLVNARQLRCL